MAGDGDKDRRPRGLAAAVDQLTSPLATGIGVLVGGAVGLGLLLGSGGLAVGGIVLLCGAALWLGLSAEAVVAPKPPRAPTDEAGPWRKRALWGGVAVVMFVGGGTLAYTQLVPPDPTPVPPDPSPVPPDPSPVPTGTQTVPRLDFIELFDTTSANGGGSFTMGSKDGAERERPAHRVRTAPFFLMRTEVTVAQYSACVLGKRCTAPDSDSDGYCNWKKKGREKHPVNCVDWPQAKAFCAWAGGRLPSEAEWEYGARAGGKDQKYPWGNEAATCARAVMDDGETRAGAGSETDGCGEDRTWPVCSKRKGNTAQGLCDMAGNVWEWTADCWHTSYRGAPKNSRPWVENCSDADRVVRGGGWDGSAFGLRAVLRFGYPPSLRNNLVGFRCARSK